MIVNEEKFCITAEFEDTDICFTCSKDNCKEMVKSLLRSDIHLAGITESVFSIRKCSKFVDKELNKE